jgi:hypothetical protein
MNFTAILEQLQSATQQLELLKKQYSADSIAILDQVFEEFFKETPEVEKVFWTQFSPYFNDGEPCEFSVHDIELKLFGEEDDEEGSFLYDQSDLDYALERLQDTQDYIENPEAWKAAYIASHPWSHNKYATPMYTTIEEAQAEVDNIQTFIDKYTAEGISRIKSNFDLLQRVFREIDEEYLEAAYGNHVLVEVTRQGTEISEYYHD